MPDNSRGLVDPCAGALRSFPIAPTGSTKAWRPRTRIQACAAKTRRSYPRQTPSAGRSSWSSTAAGMRWRATSRCVIPTLRRHRSPRCLGGRFKISSFFGSPSAGLLAPGSVERLAEQPRPGSSRARLLAQANARLGAAWFEVLPRLGTDRETLGDELGDAFDDQTLCGVLARLEAALRCSTGDPAAILGRLHERLIGRHLERAPDGSPRMTRQALRRRSAGAFFTPDYVARYMAQQTLARWSAQRGGSPGKLPDCRVVDPACGGGAAIDRRPRGNASPLSNAAGGRSERRTAHAPPWVRPRPGGRLGLPSRPAVGPRRLAPARDGMPHFLVVSLPTACAGARVTRRLRRCAGGSDRGGSYPTVRRGARQSTLSSRIAWKVALGPRRLDGLGPPPSRGAHGSVVLLRPPGLGVAGRRRTAVLHRQFVLDRQSQCRPPHPRTGRGLRHRGSLPPRRRACFRASPGST